MAGRITDPFVLARFFKCVSFSQEKEGCWEWQGIMNSNGYGRFSYENGQPLAHRLSFEIFFGDVPEGLVVCHSCDNRKCVNPAHLRADTQSANLAEAVAKGRFNPPTLEGSENGNSKLDWPAVRHIRRAHGEGAQMTRLANLYGVSLSTVSLIVKNKTWKESHA